MKVWTLPWWTRKGWNFDFFFQGTFGWGLASWTSSSPNSSQPSSPSQTGKLWNCNPAGFGPRNLECNHHGFNMFRWYLWIPGFSQPSTLSSFSKSFHQLKYYHGLKISNSRWTRLLSKACREQARLRLLYLRWGQCLHFHWDASEKIMKRPR